ncbi:MAG: prepilin-type N-terminal cleavage/methylation domain-containing protein [Planctomycetaceae bacterium]|nr:prepilin-type N-terminal cleavage/methylation domain-containing protein [Planctomycetaceae bacterium]
MTQPTTTPGTARRGRSPRRGSLRGFTLVEMLVAVTLVLIMLMMFAQVFEIASGMHHQVQGTARNDQRGRIIANIFQADLDKRSFRHLVPFAPGETAYGRDRRIEERQGYFYVSENNPYDDTDDCLQLTVRSAILRTNADPTPYYGLVSAWPIGSTVPIHGLNRQETGNSANAAEISYFLRNGVLYRRILLLYQSIGRRPQPFDDTNSREFFDTNHPTPYLPSNQNAYNAGGDNTWNTRDDKGNFWKDFDFSAQYTSTGAKLHNNQSLINIARASNFPLGIPSARFGHDHATGLPREFAPGPGPDSLWSTTDDGPFFIGRFTHEETSHYLFRYPQTASKDTGGNLINDGNPMKSTNVGNNPLVVDDDGVVRQYRGGPRRSEDILMSNVHSFDIKVWDELAMSFVDIGHLGAIGDFTLANRANQAYGPGGPSGNRVFDTWHPTISSAAPYRPTHYVQRTTAANRKGSWTPSTPYSVGNVVFPENEPGGTLAFLCTQITGAGLSRSLPPDWSESPGTLIRETEDLNNNLTLDMGEDTNGNGQLDSITWQTIDNWLPLKAIRITIRYRDPNSELLRQMTQIYTLSN